MNQFFKIALDHPAKAEKVFLWLLQSLLIFWFLSAFFNLQLGFCITDADSFYIDQECLKSISLLDIVFYLIIYVLTWFIVWEFLADLVIKITFVLLNEIIGYFWRIIREILFATIYLAMYLFSLFKLIQKPNKYWKKLKREKPEDEYFNKMTELREALGAFTFINKITNSAFGYQNLLNVISYEKGQFIQSRVIRYYTILVIVLIAKSSVFDLTNLTTLKMSILIICILLGFLVFELNNIYSRLKTNDVHFLIPQLKFDIYKDFLCQSLSNSIVISDYSIINKRRFIELNLKVQKDDSNFKENYFREILFIPIDNVINNLNQILYRFKNNKNVLVVIVSNHELTTYDRNRIFEAKYCHIQTTDKSQLNDAILALRPIFIGSRKL